MGVSTAPASARLRELFILCRFPNEGEPNLAESECASDVSRISLFTSNRA